MVISSLQNKTAILIFANSAQEDAKQKAIPHTTKLFQELSKYTLTEVKKTTLPYFYFTEKEQKGSTFGDRFTNAIQAVFNQGYENIITIGNDTPQLKASHLIKTYKALAEGKTVLGPSLDGGFYLMGLHKSNFEPETFKRLPWQRFSLLHKISDILKNTDCFVYKLPTLGDIDGLTDIKRISSFIKSVSATILHLLVLLIKIENPNWGFTKEAIFTLTLQLPFNKGSPLALHL